MKTLKIQSLSRGWHDRDEVLLHAAFQVLVDFIEAERPHKVVDWNADKLHKHAWREMMSLYTWWTKTRPARRSPLANKRLAVPPLKLQKIPNSKFYRTIEPGRKKYAGYFRALTAHIQLEQKWFDEDQSNLHRLVDIRGFLWT